MRKTRYRIIEKTLTIIMAMALILTNIQIGAFAVINEVKNQTTIEQNVGDSSTAARQEKPKIEILNDSGRSIKADSENFNFTNDTSLKVKIDTKKKPTVLTLKLPYYYKFADNISEDENYTVLSVDDAIPADMGTDSEIMRNLIKIEVPAAKDGKEKQLSIILPIQLNKEALLKSIKKDKESKNKQTSGTKNTDNVSKKENSSKKQATESKNTENVSNKESNKNIEVISPNTKNIESVSQKKDTTSQSESITSKKSDSSQNESISQKSKNTESVSEKEKTDSKSTESVKSIKSENSSLMSTESIGTKFSKKSVKTEDMSKANNLADNPSETSFILTAEQSQVFVESGEDSTVTIPWINPNSIKIDENDLKEDSNTEETDLSQVAGSLEKDLAEINTDIKHLTGLVDNKDVADLLEENINDTNDTKTDTTSKETVSSGSHSSKDKTVSKIDSTSDTEKNKNTASDKKTDTDKKSEEDKNKEPDKKTDKTEEQNSKKEDGKEEQGKTAEENKDSTNVVTNPIDDNVLGKAEEPGKENEIPILKPENGEIAPGELPLAITEQEAKEMLDKLAEVGMNPLMANAQPEPASKLVSGQPQMLDIQYVRYTKNAEGKNIDEVLPTKDIILTDIGKDKKVLISYTAELNKTEDTPITIQLPDYLQFGSVVKVGPSDNYIVDEIIDDTSTDANAKRNMLKIRIPKSEVPSNPVGISFDLSVELNDNSITAQMMEAWKKQKWNLNGTDEIPVFTDFSAKVDNGIDDKEHPYNHVVKKATFTTQDYDQIWANFYPLRPEFAGPVYKKDPVTKKDIPDTSPITYIPEHALGAIPFEIYYSAPNYYKYGPITFNETTVTAPDGFYFLAAEKFAPNEEKVNNSTKNLSKTATYTISEDGKSATIKWEDDSSDPTLARYVGRLAIVPLKKYWNTNNQDPDKMYPRGAVYPFKTVVNYTVSEKNKKKNLEPTLKVMDYKLIEKRWLSVSGKETEEGDLKGKKILQQVGAGETRTIGKMEDHSTDDLTYPYPVAASIENPYNIFYGDGAVSPSSDGAGTVITMDFGEHPKMKLNFFGLNAYRELPDIYNKDKLLWYESVKDSKLDHYTYYVEGDSTPKTIIPKNNDYTFKNPTEKKITKVEMHFSKFAYVGMMGNGDNARAFRNTGNIQDMNYTVDDDAEVKSLLPIKYTLSTGPDHGNKVITESTNYIYINKEKDPQWMPFRQLDKANKNVSAYVASKSTGYGDGTEYRDENGNPGFLGLYLKDNFVGNIDTGKSGEVYKSHVLSKLEKPVFTMDVPLYSTTYAGMYFTDGNIYLHKGIKDGWKDWNIEFYTWTPKMLKENRQRTDANKYEGMYKVKNQEDVHTWNLREQFGLKDDEVIVGYKLSYIGNSENKGMLDISPLSNKWNPEEKIEANKLPEGIMTDKALYKFGIKKLSKDPLAGMYYGGQYSLDSKIQLDSDINDDSHRSGFMWRRNNEVYVAYDNDVEPDNLHGKTNEKGIRGKMEFDSWNYVGYFKGADLVVPRDTLTKWHGGIKQNSITTLTADIHIVGSRYGDGKVFSHRGETFYFKLSKTAKISNFIEGSAKIDGVPAAEAKVVEINGEKYLKVTADINKDGPIEKKIVGDNGYIGVWASNDYVFEPWKISFDVYTTPSARPQETQLINEDGNWIDLTKIQTVKLKEGDKPERVYAIQKMHYGNGILGYTDDVINGVFANRNKLLNNGNRVNWTVTASDPLKLEEYKNSGTTDYHWAVQFEGEATTPDTDNVEYLYLLPGLDRLYQKDVQVVKPDQENRLTTYLSIIAPKTIDMKEFTSEIRIPRKGDLSASTDKEGHKQKSNVNLYLRGPLEMVDGFQSDKTKGMKILYGDESKHYYTKEDVEKLPGKWNDIRYIKIDIEFVESKDLCVMNMPLKTEAAKDEDKYVAGTAKGKDISYDAFMDGWFRTKTIISENYRITHYNFKPYKISGRIWDDKNPDGYKGKYNTVEKVEENGQNVLKPVEKDEPDIDLVDNKYLDEDNNIKTKLLDLQIKGHRVNSKGEVEASIDSIYEQDENGKNYNVFNKDGTYEFYTNQFKDISIGVDFTDEAKKDRWVFTKYNNETQNVFKDGTAQRIIAPGSNLSQSTPGMIQDEMKGLDCGIEQLPPLPDTGGIGELIFYAAGLLVVGMSFISTKVLLKL